MVHGKLFELKAHEILLEGGKFKALNRVVATVKVVSVQEVKEVKSGLRKQDYIVGDATGAATVTLWDNNIGTLKLGVSYKLSGMMVREFNEKKMPSRMVK